MKNFKPAALGGLVGAALMFVALQYHVVRSHDGLQLIPRAPKASLGLAWADIRDWTAEQWADRPELARALVAHGASDLIAESVRRDVISRLGADTGAIGELRDLLNESVSSAEEDPLLNDEPLFDDDSLTIPFPQESRRLEWGDPFVGSDTGRPNRTNIADRSDFLPGGTQPRASDTHRAAGTGGHAGHSADSPQWTSSTSQERQAQDPYTRMESHFEDRRSSGRTSADERRRESARLEDLLFSDEWDDAAASEHSGRHTEPSFEPSEDEFFDERSFDSVRRNLDDRVSATLNRIRGSLPRPANVASAPGPSRTRAEPEATDSAVEETVPRAIQALRDGFDPFLR